MSVDELACEGLACRRPPPFSPEGSNPVDAMPASAAAASQRRLAVYNPAAPDICPLVCPAFLPNTDTLPPMPNPTRAFLLGPLLKGVSRSFYLTLRVLPAGMRDPIGLAYLLA